VPELEEESMKLMEKDLGIPIYGVGPQLSEAAWDSDDSSQFEAGAPGDAEILSFLDMALEKYGKNSAVYISFGSIAWPVYRPEMVEIIVDSLLAIEPPIPFVFATPKSPVMPVEKISAATRKRIHESGRGIVSDWAPQVRCLKHPATGMTITHAGIGGVYESIVAGVPIITLPFHTDQIGLSAFYTRTLGCGTQLYQFSSGHDGLYFGTGVRIQSTRENMLKELNGVWEKLRGAQGAEWRQNVEKTRETFRMSLENGKASETMMSLSKYFTQ